MTDRLQIKRRPLLLHGERLICAATWRADLEQLLRCHGGNWATLSAGDLVAESATAQCFRISLASDTESAAGIYFKRDSYRLRRGLRYLLRPSRNCVEAFACGELRALGIASPELLAVAERRRFGLPISTLIITREIPDTVDLYRFVHDVWARQPRPQRELMLRRVCAVLVEQLQRAHASGFFHQDLKFRNLLIRENDATPELFWIDAPRARRRRWFRRRGVILDLSALARVAMSMTSRFSRMRFLRTYLGATARPGDAARLYREVARHLSRRPPQPLQLAYPESH